MAMKIYTKTGDTGKTSLLGGTKVSKGDLRIEAYGSVDELNACVGLLWDHVDDDGVKKILKEIQDRLFTIGSTLAMDPDKTVDMPLPDLHESDVELLEAEMDKMDAVLPVMKHFILPGGAPVISFAHLARTVCRRAERNCIRLNDHDGKVPPLLIKYLNRLSDYFFMVARYIGHTNGIPEIAWRARV